jgi:hypothetical protein
MCSGSSHYLDQECAGSHKLMIISDNFGCSVKVTFYSINSVCVNQGRNLEVGRVDFVCPPGIISGGHILPCGGLVLVTRLATHPF